MRTAQCSVLFIPRPLSPSSMRYFTRTILPNAKKGKHRRPQACCIACRPADRPRVSARQRLPQEAMSLPWFGGSGWSLAWPPSGALLSSGLPTRNRAPRTRSSAGNSTSRPVELVPDQAAVQAMYQCGTMSALPVRILSKAWAGTPSPHGTGPEPGGSRFHPRPVFEPIRF